MSIDTLGARAALDLFAATSDVDVEGALNSTRRRPSKTPYVLLVAACLALVLVATWMGSRILLDEQSAPPLDDAPRQVVGAALSVPAQVTVPDGWQVTRDDATVVLTPLDGSDASITLVGQPVKVYQPPGDRLKPLREDLVVWVTTHPDLAVSDRFGLDGPEFAWTGTQMELAPANGRDQVPLLPLPESGSDAGPLAVDASDDTYLFDVIYPSDSPPLVIASRSSRPDDDVLKAARNQLLQSLQLAKPSTE